MTTKLKELREYLNNLPAEMINLDQYPIETNPYSKRIGCGCIAAHAEVLFEIEESERGTSLHGFDRLREVCEIPIYDHRKLDNSLAELLSLRLFHSMPDLTRSYTPEEYKVEALRRLDDMIEAIKEGDNTNG